MKAGSHFSRGSMKTKRFICEACDAPFYGIRKKKYCDLHTGNSAEVAKLLASKSLKHPIDTP